MISLRGILVWSLLTTVISTASTNISALNDPIENIALFLSYPEQSQARLINREFNARINRSHSTMRHYLERLSVCIDRVFGAEEDADQCIAVQELQSIEDDLNLNEIYIKSWPKMLKRCLHQYNATVSARNTVQLSVFYTYRHLQHLNLTADHEMDTVTKLLIYSSRMMMQSMLCIHDAESPGYYAFSAFVLRTTWDYLSASNNSMFRLPPLRSLYHLHLNEAIYGPEIRDLRRLDDEHGLMIWDPERLDEASEFDPNLFCFFMEKYTRISHWFKFEHNYDPQFLWYFRVEFALAILNGSTCITDLSVNNEQFGVQYLSYFVFSIVRRTMLFLWKHHRWGYLMERFILGLLDGDAFEILDAPFGDEFPLDSFVRIIRNIQDHYPFLTLSSSVVCLAKSIYFWFIEQEEARSVAEMHAFSDFAHRTGTSIFLDEIKWMAGFDVVESHPGHVMDRFVETFMNITDGIDALV